MPKSKVIVTQVGQDQFNLDTGDGFHFPMNGDMTSVMLDFLRKNGYDTSQANFPADRVAHLNYEASFNDLRLLPVGSTFLYQADTRILPYPSDGLFVASIKRAELGLQGTICALDCVVFKNRHSEVVGSLYVTPTEKVFSMFG